MFSIIPNSEDLHWPCLCLRDLNQVELTALCGCHRAFPAEMSALPVLARARFPAVYENVRVCGARSALLNGTIPYCRRACAAADVLATITRNGTTRHERELLERFYRYRTPDKLYPANITVPGSIIVLLCTGIPGYTGHTIQ